MHFGTIWLPYKTRRKSGRTSAKVRDNKSRRNFSQRTHPIHPIGPQTKNVGVFHTIWVHLGPFGCLTELGAKRTELVQKFVPRSRFRIFCKERTRSTTLDPKLTFGVFPTNWVHSGPFGFLTKFGAKRAELVQKFVPRSRVGNFHNKHTRTIDILERFLLFWCIRHCLVALRNSVQNGKN